MSEWELVVSLLAAFVLGGTFVWTAVWSGFREGFREGSKTSRRTRAGSATHTERG